MPQVYASRLDARIGVAREAFKAGTNTHGQPYRYAEQRQDEKGLALDIKTGHLFLLVAEWGVFAGHIDMQEFGTIQKALQMRDPDNGGWNRGADFATKVLVTKVCNELLELRGDA